MIELFYANSPNVYKVAILLEELGVPYRRTPVDIMAGDQFKPEFLAVSPNNRIPAMIDHDPEDGKGPLPIFESGAMLLYLAEKHQGFLPAQPRPKAKVTQWLMWQMGGFGPMLGQAHHFMHYSPEPVPYGVERYSRETKRLYGVLETRLNQAEYLADDYSIADMAAWPWAYFHDLHGESLSDYPAVQRWYKAIEQRPAVKIAMAEAPEVRPTRMSAEQHNRLFNLDRKIREPE
jgi:GST-like protein